MTKQNENFSFNEAPVSFNVKCYSPDGFDVMLTLRGEDSKELLGRAFNALNWLKDNGFSASRPRNELPPPPPIEDDPIALEAELNDRRSKANGANELTFEAEELFANVNKGKTYWKIKGGRFHQYGVNIWPEVLEAACKAGLIPEDELNPMQTYQLSGLLACYVENDKGQPQKVTRLVRSK